MKARQRNLEIRLKSAHVEIKVKLEGVCESFNGFWNNDNSSKMQIQKVNKVEEKVDLKARNVKVIKASK